MATIRDCAKLYFLKDEPDAQIILLRTDASDYGYGAYLCQIVGEREYPVLFMSKSFHGAELNWKTQDKECGAIYKALEKFQYLLYNRHFILETDNKNLPSLTPRHYRGCIDGSWRSSVMLSTLDMLLESLMWWLMHFQGVYLIIISPKHIQFKP